MMKVSCPNTKPETQRQTIKTQYKFFIQNLLENGRMALDNVVNFLLAPANKAMGRRINQGA
jgi:hypothetical protein